MQTNDISVRQFGNTGSEVTCVGLGGEGILRTYGQEEAAEAVIREAMDQGIQYFDCARAYAGSEGYYGRIWSKSPHERAKVFQAGKSAQRSRKKAMEDLDGTLRTMAVDHLDLWQIHDVRTEADLEAISGPDGALEAFIQAKEAGKTRFIGVTGHHDPAILSRAVAEWPVDSVMMPINPVEGVLGGFLDSTLPLAVEKGVAVIAMKVLGASHYLSPDIGLTADLLIRFALSQPITVAIVGCSLPEHVQVLASAGRNFAPLDRVDQTDLIDLFSPYARRLAFYRGVL